MADSWKRSRLFRFARDVAVHTPFTRIVVLLIVLWVIFSSGVYLAERGAPDSSITAYGEALYWGVAAFSTAGIADAPASAAGRLIGGLWIVVGSVLFFGAIVATVTAHFMREMLRPHKQLVDTIENNLEQLDDLTIEELDLLKDTVDALIVHVENLKKQRFEG